MMEKEMMLQAVPEAPLPPRARHDAPLLQRGFRDLFRLGVAALVINILSNTFKLDERIPALRIPLSLASLAVGVLVLIAMWRMSEAVPRFRKAVYWGAAPLAVTPLIAWVDAPGVLEKMETDELGTMLLALSALLFALLLAGAAAKYQQLTACAEAFDGSDDAFAAKWRKLCTWMVVLVILFGAVLALTLLLTETQGPFFYLNGGFTLLLALVPIALGLAAASIVELVYQYRAAQMLE